MPTISGYSRHLAGWIDWDDHGYGDRRIRLHPLETHSHAVRLPNGAPGHDHWLGLENRQHLVWPARHLKQTGQPPDDRGRGIVPYRMDDHGRLRQVTDQPPDFARRQTSLIRRRPNVVSGWQPGERLGETPEVVHRIPGTLRNPLGELWWTTGPIPQSDEKSFPLDLEMQAMDLIEDHLAARWTSHAPERGVNLLEPGRFHGPTGHVMRVSDTPEIGGRSHDRALYLHPSWAPFANVRGQYGTDRFGGMPYRVYAKIGLADDARASDGVRFRFGTGHKSCDFWLQPGDLKEVSVDLLEPTTQLVVRVDGGRTATQDWAWLMDAYAVPLPQVIHNLIASADQASWKSRSGGISFGRNGGSDGEASRRSRMRLHNGIIYGPQVLFTHPNWQSNGYIEGEWTNLSIPSSGAFLRGSVGFGFGRHVTETGNEEGARIDVKISEGGGEEMLIKGADLSQRPEGKGGFGRRDLTILELPIPDQYNGKTVTIRIRVRAAGTAAQDWVSWPHLMLAAG